MTTLLTITTPETTNPDPPLYTTEFFGSFHHPWEVSNHLGLSFYFKSWDDVNEYEMEIVNDSMGIKSMSRDMYPTKNWEEYDSDLDSSDDEWEEPPSKKTRTGILKDTYVPPPLCSLQLLEEKFDKKFQNLKWVDKIEKEFHY